MQKHLDSSIFIAPVIFIVIFFICFYFSHIGVDPHHDGLMLKNALDVYNGKMLFKDSYTPYGALTTLIHSWFMMFFGVKIFSLKIASSVFYAGSGVLIWLIAKRFLSTRYSLIVIALCIANLPFFTEPFYPWASVYATFFVLLTQYLILLAFPSRKSQKKRLGFFILSGAAATCAFWSKQPYITTVLAVCLMPFIYKYIQRASIRKCWEEVVSILFGIVLVNGIFFSWLFFNNALDDWFVETIRLGYITGRVLGEHFNFIDFVYVMVRNPLGLVIPLSVCSLIVYESRKFIKNRTKVDSEVLILCLIALSALLSYYPLYDLSHRFWASTPSYVVLGIAISKLYVGKLSKFNRVRFSKLIYSTIILILGFSLSFDSTRNIISGLNKATTSYETISYPLILSGLKVSREEANSYRDLAKKMDEYFKINQNSSFVVLGGDALALTFTSYSHNTGPYFVDFSDITSGVYPYNQELDSYISRSHPLVLVTKIPRVIPSNYRIVESWPALHSTLVAQK